MPTRTGRMAMRAAVAVGLLAFLSVPGLTSNALPPAGSHASRPPAGSHATPPFAPAAVGDPVIAAAGDISRPPPATSDSGHARTSDLIVAMNPTAVLTLGDNQYDAGRLSD